MSKQKNTPKVGEMFNMGFGGLVEIVSVEGGYLQLSDPKIPKIPVNNLIKVDAKKYLQSCAIAAFRKQRAEMIGDIKEFWDFNERDVD